MQFEGKKGVALFVAVVAIACAVGLGSGFGQTSEDGVKPSRKPSTTASRAVLDTSGMRENKSAPEHVSQENQQPTILITTPPPLSPPWVWHDKWLWLANLVLAIVGIGGVIAAISTLCVLRRQTKANWVAAKASLRQTNYMITSERAWFVCGADLQWDSGKDGNRIARVHFTYENMGKTPGFITEIGFAVNVMNKEQRLPEIPPDYQSEDKAQWIGGRGVPIVPGGNMGRRADCPLTQAQFDEWQREELTIWVHGYVKYRDCFVEMERETRYCLRLKPSTEGGNAVPFVIDGPPAYNSAT
jgi:hypothetical protein